MKVLNDLYDYGLKIYQDNDLFKFSIDSILIAEFANIKMNDKVIDLCSGNGVIPLILSEKYPSNECIGIELQPYLYQLAEESISFNKKNNIKMINDDIKNLKNYFPGNNFDVVICNPPYFKNQNNKVINNNEKKAIARHEIKITLDEIFSIASWLLNNKKKFYLVHLSERLDEIFLYATKYGMKIKKMVFIYPKKEKYSNICLFEIVKNASYGVKLLLPLYISDYTSYKDIFEKE